MPEIDDLEADILSAMKPADTAPVVETPAESVAAAIVDDPAPVEGETAEQRQARIDATGRAHDEKGRFASKPKDETTPSTDVKPAETAGKLMPPASWAPEAKAAFLEAPEHVQKAMLKRTEEMETGQKEWATKAEDYNRIQKTIAPHMTAWQREGVSPDVAIGRLLAAQSAIERDPVEGLTYILSRFVRQGDAAATLNAVASRYGYALTQANNQGDAPTNGQPRLPAQADPTASRDREQIEALTKWKEKQEQAETTRIRDSLNAEVNAVKTDPKNIYFENVKSAVAALASQMMDAGDTRPAKEIVQDAYDQAVWANPSTRSLQLAAQQKATSEAANKAAADKAAAARNAAASITGSPGVGAPTTPARNGSKLANLDQDITADIMAALGSGRA